uniref:F-box protein n=1 Tax=Kalanchoe fedtschenkoi TaxID=63787 RepID=A0A7N0T5G5_KALFE
MQLPEEACVAGKRNALTVVCGSKLGFMQYGLRNWDCKCDVWVMECYGVGESWKKLFSLNLEGFLGEPRLPLGFRRNGDLLLATADSELASLEPDTGRFSQLGIFGDLICVDTSYVETLALINREESSSRTS